VLDRYLLLERLGAGGFGEVWRARDERLHRQVAVKRIRLGPDGDRERATREALACARLCHPAIVALYEARAQEEDFFLISELVEGRTLAELIAGGGLADEQVLEVGLALAGALAHAHARGVIHRDIKPQNVLVPRDRAKGAAKLTDFGGASLLDGEALTRTGDVLGTLAYMAPEQSEGAEVGEQADLYALALVLYEALSGVNPVRGATPAATARTIGTRLPSLARARRDLPAELVVGLDTALAPAPEQRGTLEELASALESTLARGPRRVSHRRRGATPSASEDVQADEAQAEEPPRSSRVRAPALPRGLWICGALALIVWQLAAGRPGVALLALAAFGPLLLLPARPVRRRIRQGEEEQLPPGLLRRHMRARLGPGWLACALAPALGLLGLAGAFPALAGQARGWRTRAALAALGFWWLGVGETLLGRRLWHGSGAGLPARSAWEGSAGLAAHALSPLFTLAVLLGALAWACAAASLPWLVRGRAALADAALAGAWSAALALAQAQRPLLGAGGHAPRGLVVGALAAAALAVGARALRGPV
jgi:hypothetical protein